MKNIKLVCLIGGAGINNMAEEVLDEQLETSQEDEKSSTKKTLLKSAGDVIMEGKRTKKNVERLDFQAPKHKEKLRIAEGSGDKLGDIPRTNFQISKLKPADLKPLHAILFERPGKVGTWPPARLLQADLCVVCQMATMKKNLRLFNGFPFNAGSEQYLKKREKLLRCVIVVSQHPCESLTLCRCLTECRNSHLTNAKLKVVCGVLDLEKKGTHSDLVDRILMFLLAPKNSGKRLPVKKKKRSKKKVTADQSTAKSKKKSNANTGRASSSSSSPKKSKAGSKSNAIVMDSSSDDDNEDDEDEEEKAAEEDRSSQKDEDSSERSIDEEEEVEVTKSKKRSRTPAKKTPPPRKRLKRDLSDDDLDSDEAEKAKKKKKPAARTKKADSSSRNTNTDTSDEDEPLSSLIKRAPSDEQLKETVRDLLKDADLEEMTMKQICQKVFDTYPDHDLTSRKDFIKQSVKSLIT
ncbi:protein DEK-like isoform X2 [Dunckerocampus dactyliophorus]|uniref:protein DEK-like isoform X2 n=1 Tax=Dunckerocampus dactyliophorus TaxID=161453 RepID=UPI002405DEF8|nr:protein DEK-like isoform X2 [Dunckerocampus dactyliophorus]